MESSIINLIKTDPEWKQTITDLNIRMKSDGNLMIFNYGVGADFTNPIVREARGIIIDTKNLRVVTWPFTKFCNVGEPGAEIDLVDFDWDHCSVEEKIDGSIVKLSWLPFDDDYSIGRWFWSTNSVIDAFSEEARAGTSGMCYGELITSAINYKKINHSKLKKDCTYIFELVSPYTQVVVGYPTTKLYHIGTRNNRTGQEYKVNIGIEQPKVYDLHTLEDCMRYAEQLNKWKDTVEHEGFVVVDKNFHRIKIKSPEYLMAHKLWNNGNISKKEALRWLQDHDPVEIETSMVGLLARIKFYDYQLSELTYQIQKYIAYTRGLYEEFDHDRKAVANMIKNDRLASFGFAAIGNDLDAPNILKNAAQTLILKLIPSYNEITVSSEKR